MSQIKTCNGIENKSGIFSFSFLIYYSVNGKVSYFLGDKKMKKYIFFLLSLFFIVSLAGIAKASPMYYTFEGTLSYINQDDAGFIAGAGLGPGDSIYYIVLVDKDEDGTKTWQNDPPQGIPDTPYYDNYYSDYIAGSAISNSDANNGWTEYNVAWDYLWTGSEISKIKGLGDWDYFLISSQSGGHFSWVLGETATVEDIAFSTDHSTYSSFSGSLTITVISDTDPTAVPVPATILLFGTGVIALAQFRRKNSRQ
ncbi:MAG: PEP-CTERM sorting domain-containing protein [Deltaproteobacteria bacterium]|nr:PEP-CTERM sorting domain-containing protein [Deltaproteobacteria bacterium]